MLRNRKKSSVLFMVSILLLSSFSLILISCEQSYSDSNNEKISTQELVQAVLDSDIIMTVYAYDNLQAGFNFIASAGDLKELLKREDAAYWVTSSYQAIDPLALKEKWTDSQKGNHAYKVAQLEILLSKKVILENLDEEELNQLAEEALTKYNKKLSSTVYGRGALNHSVELMGHILLQAEYEPFQQKVLKDPNIDNFLETSNRFVSESVHQVILNDTEQFVSD